MADQDGADTLVALTADIVSAHLSHNAVPVADVPALILQIHGALASLAAPAPAAEAPREPAVPVRQSVKPDYIVCLEDGKKLKMLRRHLLLNYNLTPEQYRRKWNLPADYPMVAPNYTEQRRSLAKKIGLGTQPRKR